MTQRERFHAIMNFQSFDRLPLLEWAGWWDKTVTRWCEEGLPPDVTGRHEICRHFGLDIYKHTWFRARGPNCPEPEARGTGIIASEKDYEKIRPYLYPRHIVDKEKWKNLAEEQQRGDVVLWFTLDGFFWFPRILLGIERHLNAFYDQPHLMHRINTDLTEWMSDVIEELCPICSPDFMTFAEDLSYNHGPMLSGDQFETFLTPYYQQIIPQLRRHNIHTLIDSDGDITLAADWFKQAGIEGVLPLERQAGVDIGHLREQQPDMKFIGHFNKMTMDQGEEAMRAEFERLLPVAAKGGFLISCDHQTPPSVSYEAYKTYVALFHEYAEKAGDLSQRNAEHL